MNKKHFLSETAVWVSQSEFVDPQGNISYGEGESHISILSDYIENESFAGMKGKMVRNDYTIRQLTDNHYKYQSNNPALGIQVGCFDVDRNTIYSNFSINNTQLNGYEVIIRMEDVCYTYGALYKKKELVNTWKAVMKKRTSG